jgi:putative hydrolase of the HAD superfamily
MNPKGILFDLDDTIIKLREATDYTWNKMFILINKLYNNEIDNKNFSKSLKKIRRWYWKDPKRHRIGRFNIKMARKELIEYTLKEMNIEMLEEVDNILERYDYFRNNKIALFSNAIETLERLNKNNFKLCLVTNGTSKSQRWKIERFNLGKYFEEILIEEEIGFGKPDERVFEIAIKRMNISADNLWMVGDNIVWDVKAPQKLGVYSIWNDFLNEGLRPNSTIKPDLIINDISEILNYIEV